MFCWSVMNVCKYQQKKSTSHDTENCSFQKKNRVREEERLIKACEVGMDYGKHMFSFLSH